MSKEFKIIGHLDLDAFFASVEERENPWAQGLPIAIGSDPMEGKGRGVVSTANYKARKYGIHSALPISKAWHFSEQAVKEGKPAVVFMRGSMKKYSEVSEKVMEIIEKHVSLVERASIDEAYFDLSNCKSYEEAESVADKIKKEIRAQEKITASIGIGPNKLVAKIASDMEKPDGLTVVKDFEAENFLEPLSIRKIPGIGPKAEERFHKIKIHTVEDLKRISQEDLYEMMGKWGLVLYEKARGRDNSKLGQYYERKSIGEQRTFFEDSLDFGFVWENFQELCEDIYARLKISKFNSFMTVTITVRFSDFKTNNRSHTLSKHARTLKAIKTETLKLLMPFFDSRENPRHMKIRLVGVRIEKLK